MAPRFLTKGPRKKLFMKQGKLQEEQKGKGEVQGKN